MIPLAMTKLKNALVKIDPNLKVELKNVRINGQLQGCSGFVTDPATGKIVYVNTDTGIGKVLYRSAESNRDYRGDTNRYTRPLELPQAVVDLLR